ncbi:hypothetical protein DFH09DRAFT_1359211 [Mycena vulgaris]|nr:hypothetical protein DFH09DRAFT_1359211 [Mycena vulgaris]
MHSGVLNTRRTNAGMSGKGHPTRKASSPSVRLSVCECPLITNLTIHIGRPTSSKQRKRRGYVHFRAIESLDVCRLDATTFAHIAQLPRLSSLALKVEQAPEACWRAPGRLASFPSLARWSAPSRS